MYTEQRYLGDWFNDMMTAIVPAWQRRPEWMKKVKIKLSPQRMVEQLRTVAPETAAKAEILIREQGEQAATSYLRRQYEGARTNPLVWAGAGIMGLLLLGSVMGGFGAKRRR